MFIVSQECKRNGSQEKGLRRTHFTMEWVYGMDRNRILKKNEDTMLRNAKIVQEHKPFHHRQMSSHYNK